MRSMVRVLHIARATGYGRLRCDIDVLHVRLHGGYYVYGPQKADLQFICDHGVDEVRKSLPDGGIAR